MTDKELWKSMMLWVQIDKEDQEKLALVRNELAILGSREKPKQEMLRVQLYR